MHQINKKIITICLLSFLWLNFVYGQENSQPVFNLKEHQEKASYRDMVRHMFVKEYTKGYPTYGVSTLNDKQELWRIYSLDKGKQILEIESYENGIYYKEVYYSKNDNLMYAQDAERYIQNNSLENRIWKCEFFLKNKKVYSEESLGHGKTEHDDWNPKIIFSMYKKRKNELKILQKN